MSKYVVVAACVAGVLATAALIVATVAFILS